MKIAKLLPKSLSFFRIFISNDVVKLKSVRYRKELCNKVPIKCMHFPKLIIKYSPRVENYPLLKPTRKLLELYYLFMKRKNFLIVIFAYRLNESLFCC